MPTPVKKPKKKFSPGYQKLLKVVNDSPALLSVLYDMGLLPELVDDKKTRSPRECFIALMIGYRVGKIDAQRDAKPSVVAARNLLAKRLKP